VVEASTSAGNDPVGASIAESPHPITLLPFVHDERPDDDHNKQRDFWHVDSSGQYWSDCLYGNDLARHALRYMDETSDGGLLRLVVHAMVARGPERWGGIEIGFFERIEPRLVPRFRVASRISTEIEASLSPTNTEPDDNHVDRSPDLSIDTRPAVTHGRAARMQILSLFREWMDAERIACALAECYEELGRTDEYHEALGRTNSLIGAISDIPAAGAASLAIKAYLAIHAEDEMLREDYAALSTGEEWDHADFKRSILRDVVRFVPELASFAAAALADEPAAEAEGDDAEPDVIGFGEPDDGGAA
jgi:hypothetical protein